MPHQQNGSVRIVQVSNSKIIYINFLSSYIIYWIGLWRDVQWSTTKTWHYWDEKLLKKLEMRNISKACHISKMEA